MARSNDKITVFRYPSVYDGNMPFIIFTPYNFKAPLPETALAYFDMNGNGRIAEFGGEQLEKNDNIPQVALYVPGSFSENIAAEWSPEPLVQGAGGNWGANFTSNFTDYMNNLPGAKGIVSSLSAYTARAAVPTDMLVFKHISPMSLSFTFKMIPYNKDEAETISGICTGFKRNIMPIIDKELRSVVLKFPVIWDLDFTNFEGIGIGKNKNSYKSMALVGCNVSYESGIEGAGVYEDGKYPVQTVLSLTFQSIRKHWLEE